MQPAEPFEFRGFLSHIFSGSSIFPALDIAAENQSIHTRLCEIAWLEPALFHLHPAGPVILLIEEYYSSLTARLNRPITPGALGEQIVVRGINPRHLTVAAIIKIGDAVLEVTIPPDQASPLYPACTLQFIEEGLAEPGAPVVIKNK